MFIMKFLKVVDRNGTLSFSGSLLDAGRASFRIALDIDDSFDFGDFVQVQHIPIALKVDLVLGFAQDFHVMHDAGEDIAI